MPRMELALLIFAAMCLSKLRSWSIMTLISFYCSVLCSGARSFLNLTVQCCALSRSSWSSSQSVLLCIALNSLVSSANRYRYEWMILSDMSLINITKRSRPRTYSLLPS